MHCKSNRNLTVELHYGEQFLIHILHCLKYYDLKIRETKNDTKTYLYKKKYKTNGAYK